MRRDINDVFPADGPLGANASEYAREIHGFKQRPRHYRQIIARAPFDIFSIDLAVMHGWRDEWFGRLSENDGYKYMLLVVDTFSRYLWAFPLKGKSANEVKLAFESIKHTPRAIMADQGKEFMGEFLRYCRQKGITIYNPMGEHKAAIAERAIRTVQSLLWKLMTARQTRKWVPLLPLVVEYYNSTVHSALHGLTPEQATQPANSKSLWLKEYGQVQPNIAGAFKVGDHVRVSVQKTAFSKGYQGNWSLDAYEITEVSPGRPVMYSIAELNGEPVQGRFYEEELKLTKFPRIEIEKEVTVAPKRAGFTAIERVLDAEMGEQDGMPMVFLKMKWEGLSNAENEALPRSRLWLPYTSLQFDSEGEPNPAIVALLKQKRLWTKAQAYKVAYFKAKARGKAKRRGGFIW
jgi:hypothetical protein